MEQGLHPVYMSGIARVNVTGNSAHVQKKEKNKIGFFKRLLNKLKHKN